MCTRRPPPTLAETASDCAKAVALDSSFGSAVIFFRNSEVENGIGV
jgi:hypothetical protein